MAILANGGRKGNCAILELRGGSGFTPFVARSSGTGQKRAETLNALVHLSIASKTAPQRPIPDALEGALQKHGGDFTFTLSKVGLALVECRKRHQECSWGPVSHGKSFHFAGRHRWRERPLNRDLVSHGLLPPGGLPEDLKSAQAMFGWEKLVMWLSDTGVFFRRSLDG